MDNFYCLKESIESAIQKNGPFLFEESLSTNQNNETPCLLCEDTFNLNEGLAFFLRHLFEVHSVVIEDVQNISYLTEYIKFWRDKFKSKPMEEIIPSHKLKLNYVLKVQEFERTDDKYSRPCLYCKLEFEGTRPDFIKHLSTDHNLQLGNPHNLVFIEELIEKIEKIFKDLVCLYCEKTFPERHILKEHMRKKLHKRINVQNKQYDKYFMVNYLEDGKDWQDIKKETDRYALTRDANSDEEYSDWNEEEDKIACLFCDHKETDVNKHFLHLKNSHNFDFEELTKSFDFFQKIQLINYVRRQMVDCKCIYCEEHLDGIEVLKKHMVDADHFKLPDMEVFSRAEFLFPTYEDDAFLYLIEDIDE